MSDQASASEDCLRIVHILRSPLGGLFRHVLDLAQAQLDSGHQVGLIADSSTGGAYAEGILQALAPRLGLGLHRLPMRRDPHPLDILAHARIVPLLRTARPDVVHGHGAKGALYARLPGTPVLARGPTARVYTPHGGSLHHDPASFKGALVLGMERMLARRTDLILFESGYAADRFRAAIGTPPCPVRIVHNGLRPAEFTPVMPRQDAADVVYVGELRMLKGVDVLIEALAALGLAQNRPVRAALVGSGPDRERFEALAEARGIASSITFHGVMPAREAFALGRLLVVPSRAESLPYIVLEAAAAQVPLIATRVGGIPEIFGGADDHMVPPDDVEALAAALRTRLAMSADRQAASALALSRFIETRFAVGRMADDVIAGYREALAARRKPRPVSAHRPPPRFHRYGL